VSGRAVAALVAALVLLAAAQGLRRVALDDRDSWPKLVDTPYAPSPSSARYVALGYGELGADLLYLRARIYFGGDDDTAEGLRGLVDAIVALDPHFYPVYEFAGRAITWVDGGMTQDDRLWSVGILERGLREFPDDWKLLKLTGETYIVDLETDDEAQRAAWNARGAELLEKAIRMPGAPRNLATLIAHVRSELGQHERAIEGLLELIRTTDNEKARKALIVKLAELQGADATKLADEERWSRERFDRARAAALPEAPVEMYLLLGDPPKPYIDFADLSAEPDLGLNEEVFEPIPDE
jgi:hypothetical protein